MTKRKHGGRRDLLRHPAMRQPPIGLIVWECSDPNCPEGIHHLGTPTHEPAPERDEAGASHADPIAYLSERDSEGGFGGQGTSTQ